ncbi:MAG: hypothetical protein DHS20C01_00290 [marine bacterium B5-7]|nr:MAG: hypothetical protein DHS20C01_00290 [marine bacterium B5-7]
MGRILIVNNTSILPQSGFAPVMNKRIVIFAALVIVMGTLWLGAEYNWRRGALFITGAGLGIALYHAAFGFTAAWRKFSADFDGRGLRAQMLLLAITALIFFPAIAGGELFGHKVGGYILPAGTSVIVGAFIFGIGMQLGGGCGSGTLFAVGGGNTRTVVTLIGFIAGSVIATAHTHWWYALPTYGPISFIRIFGWQWALAINLGIFAAIVVLSVYLEKRRHGTLLIQTRSEKPPGRRILTGPWSLAAGAIALAMLSIVTLWLAGRPWGITSAFALWGAKILMLFHIDVSTWPYWSGWRAASLRQSVFNDVTSVMNFGVILGAMLAAALAGRFSPTFRIPPLSLAAALVGGLMLGYGARLAFGCNIGAYFGGVVSGSLHGWFWLLAGFAGSVVGTRLRPMVGLPVEKSSPQTV